jgi:hypothetical protein
MIARNIFFLFLSAFAAHSGIAQPQKLPGTQVTFQLPNAEWTLADTMETESGLRVFSYKRTPILDKDSTSIIPNIAFLVEQVDTGTDIVVYSMQKRIAMPFEVDKVYSHDDSNAIIRHPYAIGYKGHYTQKGLEHTIYIVHLIDENWGVQIICDATSDVFPKCDSEFLKFLRSIKSHAPSIRKVESDTINVK